jgi:hypothetical protein
MPLIKTNFEMPRDADPVKQAQRLAQDLSKNFKSINNYIETISNASTLPFGLDGEVVSSNYSITIASGGPLVLFQDIVLNHNLGSVPSGYFILDLTFSPVTPADFFPPTIYRTSWTSTQIAFRINMISGTGLGPGPWTNTGTFSAIVLR